MKNYDDDKMNYDENGLYPDEKPASEKHPTGTKIISALTLLSFAAAITGMFYFGSINEGFKAVCTFFGLFLTVGILGILSDIILEERPPQSALYVVIGIGLIGIIITVIVHTKLING